MNTLVLVRSGGIVLGNWEGMSFLCRSYTPYKGLNLTNRESRKLRVLGRKLGGGATPSFLFILISRAKYTAMFKSCILC